MIANSGQASMCVLAGATSNVSTGTGILAAVFLFVFNTFFAIGWLGMTWYASLLLCSQRQITNFTFAGSILVMQMPVQTIDHHVSLMNCS